MTIQQAKKEVIKSIILRGTFDGAFRHNKIYASAASNLKRKQFRAYLEQELSNVLQHIQSRARYTDKDHYRTIATFSDRISRHGAFTGCLFEGRFRIGTAQKLLNLYWKMSWILKPSVKTPLHCPFDRIIIRQLDKSVHFLNWTQLDTIEEYQLLVVAARKRTQANQSIATWELETYLDKTVAQFT
jgi:hypothetical protein